MPDINQSIPKAEAEASMPENQSPHSLAGGGNEQKSCDRNME
jgi:hypothetical protein